jgi:LysR family transcriptional regulator, hydrogen peroxide-inducible genes activator
MIAIAYEERRAGPMNLRDLRYLLALAEQGHFGRAAEACGVSQPTLSVQIRKLEELLGVTLFERANKGVAPTGACDESGSEKVSR